MLAERKSQVLIVLGAAAAGVLALFFLDLDRLLEAWTELDLRIILAASAVVTISLFFGSRGLAAIIRRPWSAGLSGRRAFPITVMSQVASNLFSFGGLTGATMRARLLAGPEGLWAEGIAGAVTYTLAVNATSLAFCFASTLLLLLGPERGASPFIAALLPLALAAGFVVLVLKKGAWFSTKAGALALAVEARLRILRLASRVSALLERSFADARALAESTAWLMAEWFAVALALELCFRAAGHPMSFSLIIMCYGSGALATLLSFIPGGVGVLEASMAGVAVHYGGVPEESAVVAVLLYRALYYGLPIPLSLTGLGSGAPLPASPEADPALQDGASAEPPLSAYNKKDEAAESLEPLGEGEAPARRA